MRDAARVRLRCMHAGPAYQREMHLLEQIRQELQAKITDLMVDGGADVPASAGIPYALDSGEARVFLLSVTLRR